MAESTANPEKKTPPAAETPKPKAAPKAAKKPAKPKDPLVDNGDDTVTDPNSGLMWKRKDSWLDTRKFYMWQDHKAYLDDINKKKFAGYDDWRLPTKAEAVTLVDKTKELLDKSGLLIPIDPVFEAGCFATTWIQECSDDKIIRFDLKIGIDTPYPGKDIWSSLWLCRKAEGSSVSAKPGESAAAETPASPPK